MTNIESERPTNTSKIILCFGLNTEGNVIKVLNQWLDSEDTSGALEQMKFLKEEFLRNMEIHKVDLYSHNGKSMVKLASATRKSL